MNSNSAEMSPIMEICRECLVGSCSFFFSMNYCDPTAQHYAVLCPLKLAWGLLRRLMFPFDVFTGPLVNMKSFNTKGCSSSSMENLEENRELVCA